MTDLHKGLKATVRDVKGDVFLVLDALILALAIVAVFVFLTGAHS